MTPSVFEYLFSRIQKIRDDDKKGVYVDNLKEVEVATAWDVIQQLIQGEEFWCRKRTSQGSYQYQ